MNTATITTSPESSAAEADAGATDRLVPATTRRPGRILSLLLVAMLCAGAAIGVGASPASAATSGNVSFCLQYSNGAPYANKAVYLYRSNGGAWGNPVRSGSTNSSGCATWRNVATGFNYTTQGYWSYNVGSAVYAYSGWTGVGYLSAGGGTIHLPFYSNVGFFRLA